MNEIPAPLSPLDADSFAYFTFKDRLPVILARIVDSLYRNKKTIIDELGEDKIDCLKYITAEMSRLRHELTTDKAITDFDGSNFGDEQNWNDAINEERTRLIESISADNDISWYKCSFLFAECYMYRRVYDAVLKSGIPEIDQFSFEKEELLQKAMKSQQFLTKYFINIWPNLPNCNKVLLLSYFEVIMKMSLWANEVDLSLSISDEESKLKLSSTEKIIEENNNKLLIDDYRNIFELLFEKSYIKQEEVIVTIFVDNSGSELLADLHFVEFLLASRLANKVIIYTKSMPWYVSDVTERDFQLTLNSLCNSDETLCQWLGKRIYSRIFEDCNLSVRSHQFLTLPCPFRKLKTLYPDFYHELSDSTLVVFKGDLNYRKLVSDLHWPVANVSFYDSLLGFNPTTIVALRVLKCNVQVGLSNETLSRVEKEHPDDWMIASRYGVIQSCIFKE